VITNNDFATISVETNGQNGFQ